MKFSKDERTMIDELARVFTEILAGQENIGERPNLIKSLAENLYRNLAKNSVDIAFKKYVNEINSIRDAYQTRAAVNDQTVVQEIIDFLREEYNMDEYN